MAMKKRMQIWAASSVFLAILPLISSEICHAQGWQSLSPEDRRAKLQQLMKARAARQGNQSGGTTSAAQPNSDLYDLKADIAYGPAPLEKLDIYAPKNISKPAPILFYVHGGGWQNGDKSQGSAGKGASYTKEGVIFVSVNYGLAPKVVHPKQIEDIADAFAWIHSHASEFGGDPNRIYLMGHSAGAHLVDLLATNDRFLNAKGLRLDNIKGVVSLDTASLNLITRIGDDSFEGKAVGDMITKAFGTDQKSLTDGSPYLAIHQGKHYPPFLMFCGSTRRTCVAQHLEFEKAMLKTGSKVTIRQVPLSHRDINIQSGKPDAEIFQSVLHMIKSDSTD